MNSNSMSSSLSANTDGQPLADSQAQQFPKRLIPVIGLLLLLLVTNAIGSLSHMDAVTAWESATQSQIVTWSFNVTSLLCGIPVIYGLFRRRRWSVMAARWFIGLYYVAMVVKHAYFSPIARLEPFKYVVVYAVMGAICLVFVLLLSGRRVSAYLDR